ncbi:GlsB/YeaQ/YmgE family stress response membrane protein [Oscillochloris sp. ZM17-4]|uniref:GlsB/YeaQ/YmgE family stress response membrane protein n=1 Tax=Oscillochloris sp. ZM17-4 TaxID=2866714 RepID=UPI001C72B6D5|nr:GlsB/YeaQ/YmgE family stress response membrane protein [Oscillochloris sp. ZM17-4]MBX0328343.1 GlsB/YeaQ/YmgE family stress response membrane protein [Oscillochloris sp. ZM17-4]
MVNLLVWLIAGAIVGWGAGLVLRDRNGLVVNVIVGVVGAMIGGFLLGGATINENVFSLNSMVISLVGAIILLGIVHLVRRGRLA